ncbi:MAG: hypothetical protein EA421_15925 [Gemmatimonadales bacterium]|nr:MAG: hypothetical protein EA421_15925 [Gemmatimonadales bacterium]
MKACTILVGLLLLGAVACGVESEVPGGDPAQSGALLQASQPPVERPLQPRPAGAPDLARLRAGTAGYHDFTRALEAGFMELSGHNECLAHPGEGGKGIRYVHPERYGTASIDPTRPEILLYFPHPEGRMELAGVEFAVEAELWHRVHGANVMPELAGVRYDPPDPQAPDPFLESAYTLSVWLWKENPQGMFAPFNPKLDCR